MINITCIIPSLCSAKSNTVLKKCINSLIKADKKNINLKLVLVTNGEKPILRDLIDTFDLIIKVKDPYSFSKMNNVAIEKSCLKFNPEWILFINDDTTIDKYFFKYFISNLIKRKFDIAVPLIYKNNSKKIDSYGIEYFSSGHPRNSENLDFQTQLAPAACLLVSCKLLNKMKVEYSFYFNDILGSYLDDVEFSIRAIALGGKIIKDKQMIVNHLVSNTNGIKSNFVMNQSYRNLIWVVILTWPGRVILKNIFSIFMVQVFMCLQSLNRRQFNLYIKIWPQTLTTLPNLIILRHKIISAYIPYFKFESLLSPYAFRTNNNLKIKFLNIV